MAFAGFVVGGLGALALVYGPFIASDSARAGLVAAQKYHAARGGFDLTWIVGSFSRLVRWYLPVFVMLGLGVCQSFVAGGKGRTHRLALVALVSFLAVFAVQMVHRDRSYAPYHAAGRHDRALQLAFLRFVGDGGAEVFVFKTVSTPSGDFTPCVVYLAAVDV